MSKPTYAELEQQLQALRAVEAELRETTRQYRTLVQNLDGMVYHCQNDPDWTMEYVSAGALGLTGYPPQELIGSRVTSYGDLIHPDDRAMVWETVQAAIEQREPFILRYRLHTRTGEEKWVREQGRAVFSAAGELEALEGLIIDITEQQKIRLAQQESAAFYRSLFEEHPAIMFLIDPDDNAIVDANQAACDYYGWSRDELRRMNIAQINTLSAAEVQAEIQRANAVGHNQFFFKHRRADGSIRDVEVFSGPIKRQSKTLRFSIVQDITERRWAEEQLRLNLERLSLATASAGIGIWDVDLSTDQLIWDNRMHELYGLDPKTTSSSYETWTRMVHPDDLTAVNTARQSALEGSRDYHVQYRIIRPDGQTRHIEAHAVIQRDDADQPLRIIGVNRDITEQALAIQSLERNEARYRLLFDNNPHPMWVYNLETLAFLAVNNAAIAKYGYSRAEFLAMTLKDIRPVEDVSDLLADVARQRPALQRSGEWRHRLKDGQIIDVEISSHLIDFDGQPAALVLAQDITARKQADEALRQSEERYRNTLDTMLEGCQIIGFDWRYIYLNAAADTHNRRPKEELLGQKYMEMWPGIENTEVFAVIKRCMEARIAQQMDNEFVFPDGAVGWFSLSIQPVPEGVFILSIDITERKQLEEENKKLAAQFYQAQKMEAVGQLAGGIAHDFNNLLVPILGFAEMGQMSLNPTDPLQANFTHISEAADRAANLTRQILAFSRQQILEMRLLDLNQVVTDFQKMLGRLLPESINLRVKLNPQLRPIKADQGQLEQVLMNLVVNARDAMFGGGILTIETDLAPLDEIYTAQHANVKPGLYVMLAVSDTGHGMDATTQQRIFEPFFTTKERGQGTGLGLATVFGIVKQHQGNIWVYSEPGQGTTFKVYLPVTDETGVQTQTRRELSADQLTGNETVLVVEDDAGVRLLVAHALQAHGYTVLEVDSPVEALELITTTETVHLLLTDVVMPGMNGRQLYTELVQQHPELRVLFMSGYTDNVIVHHGALDPGVAFLAKPFSMHNLLQKVREVLA
ncbi:MAG: Sensor histidine kinase RcsC [Anaerolineae bacterium]|nr:Sensor histidine kinase RcsC [Anaerolineae bacterium]